MKADQVASALAPSQASAIAQKPSATSPSTGAALRLISAKSRTIAAAWVGIGSGPPSACRARLSSKVSLRRREAASGSLRPLPPPWALDSLITARHAPRHDSGHYAIQMINERLTRTLYFSHFRRKFD